MFIVLSKLESKGYRNDVLSISTVNSISGIAHIAGVLHCTDKSCRDTACILMASHGQLKAGRLPGY